MCNTHRKTSVSHSVTVVKLLLSTELILGLDARLICGLDARLEIGVHAELQDDYRAMNDAIPLRFL